MSSPPAETVKGPLPVYLERAESGALLSDPDQVWAAERLQALFESLQGYDPRNYREQRFLARLISGSKDTAPPPRGLYLWGDVGRGKSMLMDLFFEQAPLKRKRRVHFHAFMEEVHDELHLWRKRTRGAKQDPLPELAGELTKQTWLLCFDEFHVVSIADAMILGRLFSSLFERGVVVVATSNFPPGRLYEGGLQRERFLPFIKLLEERLEVINLGSGTDYRMDRLRAMALYHTPLGPSAAAALDKAFVDLTEGAEPHAGSLIVKGRRVPVPLQARGVARFAFAELCERPLGAADYLAIARHFHTVILAEVPKLTAVQRNEARRFMTLIDALYEHRCKLILSAAGPPAALYPAGEGSFEFQRTVSRLNEMQSQDYLALAHNV